MLRQIKYFYYYFIIILVQCFSGCNSDIVAPTPGLLQNPGAEAGMHYWEYTEPVIRSNNEYFQQTGYVYPRSGNFFFDMAGATVTEGSVVSMKQSMEIEDIDATRFTAGGWIQTELWPDDSKPGITDNDYGELILFFKDADANTIDSLSTGPIGNPVKGHPTTNGRQYAEFVLTGTIPVRTVTVIYELRGYLIQGFYINVFYDDLYFRVNN